MSNIVKSDRLMIFLDNDYHSMLFARSHSFSISMNTKNAHVHSDDLYSYPIPVSCSWDASAEIICTLEELQNLFTYITTQKKVIIMFGQAIDYDENGGSDWTAGSGYRGKALVDNIDVEANVGDHAIINVTFKGITSIDYATVNDPFDNQGQHYSPSKQNPNISFDHDHDDVDYDESNVYDISDLYNPNELSIRYIVLPYKGRLLQDIGLIEGRAVWGNTEIISNISLTALNPGTYTIVAIFDGNDEFNPSQVEYTITIGEKEEEEEETEDVDIGGDDTQKYNPIFYFANESESYTQNTNNSYRLQYLVNPANLEFQWVLSPNVTVSDNNLIINEIGEYVIQATFLGNERYNAAMASYTIIITEAQTESGSGSGSSSQSGSGSGSTSGSGSGSGSQSGSGSGSGSQSGSGSGSTSGSGSGSGSQSGSGSGSGSQSGSGSGSTSGSGSGSGSQSGSGSGSSSQSGSGSGSTSGSGSGSGSQSGSGSGSQSGSGSGSQSGSGSGSGSTSGSGSGSGSQSGSGSGSGTNIPNYLKFTSNTNNSTVNIVRYNNYEGNATFEYSRDGINWSEFNTTVNLSQNQFIYVRGDNNIINYSGSLYESCCFRMSGSISASGNIMSLLSKEYFENMTTIYGPYCFARLFQQCEVLTTAPELPATTLSLGCYYSMFSGCINLVSAPLVLPARSLTERCYDSMFFICYKLLSAPQLPATSLANSCYYNMFGGCRDLTTAPSILPATTLAERCYYSMFSGCESLTTAPSLPATTLAKECYRGMFQGCTSLINIPNRLPATTLAEGCYREMFQRCTSLTTALQLPATTMVRYCYNTMFASTRISQMPYLPATTLAEYCYGQMFYNCTSLTETQSLPATTLAEGCYYRMFGSCESITRFNGNLQGTTLARGCYEEMFINCSSLFEAPDLIAQDSLPIYYTKMFNGCTSLQYIKMLGVYYGNPIAVNNTIGTSWVSGVPEGGRFYKNENASWITGNNGIPSGWTVIDVTV